MNLGLPPVQRYAGLHCPLYQIFGLLAHKWMLDVLYQLHCAEREGEGPLRFRELARRVQSGSPEVRLSAKELTARLRELEQAQLAQRTSYDTAVPHVEYMLTERGLSLLPHLLGLYDWIRENELNASPTLSTSLRG